MTRLEYEAYPEMALAEMRKIGATATRALADRTARHRPPHRRRADRRGQRRHRRLRPAHRRAAFEACHFAIDRLKEVVPIWKKEHFDGGEVWIGSQTGAKFPADRKAP